MSSINIAPYQDFVGTKADKFHKATLFQGHHLMLGLNCLEPGQMQPVHEHSDQDKFYFVLAGTGLFTIGEEVAEVGTGHVIWAAAGMPHGVENRGAERLTLLMGIAPGPK